MTPLTIHHKELLIKRVELLITCIQGLETSKSDDIICAIGAGAYLLDKAIEKIQKEISCTEKSEPIN